MVQCGRSERRGSSACRRAAAVVVEHLGQGSAYPSMQVGGGAFFGDGDGVIQGYREMRSMMWTEKKIEMKGILRISIYVVSC